MIGSTIAPFVGGTFYFICFRNIGCTRLTSTMVVQVILLITILGEWCMASLFPMSCESDRFHRILLPFPGNQPTGSEGY